MPRRRQSDAPSDVDEYDDPQLTFKHPNGQPVKFFIDSLSTKFPSIPDLPHPRFSVEQAAKYERFIKKYGGERVDSTNRKQADVLIVGEAMENAYARCFEFDPRPVVVTPKFLKKCLETGKYEHEVVRKKGMGGRPANGAVKKWTPFSPEETLMLCKYIAHRVPEPAAGGRNGNKIYQDLEQHALDNPHGPWALAKNHTWQSWREHYVRNKVKLDLDRTIDRIAKDEKITSSSQGTYPFDRRAIAYRSVQEREIEEDEEDEEEGEGEQEEEKGEGGQEEEGVQEEGEGEDEEERDGTPAPRAPRRARSPNDEGEPDPGAEDREDESRTAPARKRRRTQGNHRVAESGRETWSPLDSTLNNPSAPSKSARPGPEDAGPSGTQRSPAPPPEQSSSPARPPRRQQPKPRPKARPVRAQTPLNTQQTLVNPTSPIRDDGRAGELSAPEDRDGSPEASQRLPPARASARQTRSRTQAARVAEQFEDSTGHSESAIEGEIEAILSDADAEVDGQVPEGENQAVGEDEEEGFEGQPVENDEEQEEEDDEERAGQLLREDSELDSDAESDDGRGAESLIAGSGEDDGPFATRGSEEDDDEDDDDD